ncbi:MAG: hypothetical protein IJD94_05135 [Clostridia bacterium]|nr:hypothetical protein [Clostridia bacterium]
MKIFVSGTDLKRIMSVCKSCVATDEACEARPVLGQIEIECVKGEGRATSLDGFKMIQTRFSYTGDDGVMLIPPISEINKDCEYEIEAEDGIVSFLGGGKEIIAKAYDGKFLNWRAIARKQSKPAFKIACNPSYLKSVLNQTGKAPIILEFYSELEGFFVKSKDTIGMILPVRVSPSFGDFIEFGSDAKKENEA